MEIVGRRERKKNDTHRALLAAATRLFADRGIYDTTIEEITEAADLGKGTFYKHFESRDAIIAAVLHQGFEDLSTALRAEVGGHAHLGEAVRAIVASHARFFSRHPEYLLLFHQARGWLKLSGQRNNPVRQEFATYVRDLADLLGAAAGPDAARADRERTARVLAGIVSGAFSFEIIVGTGDVASLDLADELARIGRAL